MTVFFKHISQVHTRADYEKILKSALPKASGQTFHYFDKFKFDNKEAPLVLVGEVNKALLGDIKKTGSGYATGDCEVNGEDQLVFSVKSGRVPYASLSKAVKSVGFTKDVRLDEGKQDGDSLKSKALGEEYKDEDKKLGWRKKAWDTPEDENSDRVTTKYYDEQEKQESKLSVDKKGRLRDSSGDKVDGKKGFVVDPKTGATHTFENRAEYDGDKIKTQHHSSPLSGGNVGGAGHVTTEDGYVQEIDDSSGHYKPDAKLTHQTVQNLKDQGVKLRRDDELLDSRGWEVDEDKVARRDLKRNMALKQIEKLKAERKKVFEEARSEMTKLGVSEMPKEFKKRIRKIDERLEEQQEIAAAKLNAPSNREAKVSLQGKEGLSQEEFDEVKGDVGKINALLEKKLGKKDLIPDDTDSRVLLSRPALNLAIGEATKLKLTVEQFEQTQGNEKQARAKDRLTDAIERMGPMKPSEVKEVEKMVEFIDSHGGEAKLKEMGVEVKNMNLRDMHDVLSGKISEEEAKKKWRSAKSKTEEHQKLGGDRAIIDLGLNYWNMSIDDKLAVLNGEIDVDEARKRWPA